MVKRKRPTVKEQLVDGCEAGYLFVFTYDDIEFGHRLTESVCESVPKMRNCQPEVDELYDEEIRRVDVTGWHYGMSMEKHNVNCKRHF